MIRNGAFSHKIDNITFLGDINLEGHQNRITGSRVRAIFLNGWIFPFGQSGEARNPKIHDMKTRNPQTFKAHSNTKRFENSPIV